MRICQRITLAYTVASIFAFSTPTYAQEVSANLAPPERSGGEAISGPTVLEVMKDASTIAAAVAAIFIPVVLAVIGNLYTTAMKTHEIQLRYIELAIKLLGDQPKSETAEIRRWATNVINQYSDVKLPSSAQKEFVEQKILDTFESRIAKLDTLETRLAEIESGQILNEVRANLDIYEKFVASSDLTQEDIFAEAVQRLAAINALVEVALQQKPIDSDLLNLKALVYARMARLAPIKPCTFEKSLHILPNDEALYSKAIKVLDSALKINPRSANAYYNRACYRCLRGDEANFVVEDLLKAIHIWPSLQTVIPKERDFDRLKGSPQFDAFVVAVGKNGAYDDLDFRNRGMT